MLSYGLAGAVPVAGTLNSYYEDIKSGVSDGAVVFTTGAWGAKLHEVAPYVTKVNFGSMFSGGIAVNKGRMERLPPEVQARPELAQSRLALELAAAEVPVGSERIAFTSPLDQASLTGNATENPHGNADGKQNDQKQYRTVEASHHMLLSIFQITAMPEICMTAAVTMTHLPVGSSIIW